MFSNTHLLHATQPAPEQSNPTKGGSISRFGGWMMCELSVDDGDSKVKMMTGAEIGATTGTIGTKMGSGREDEWSLNRGLGPDGNEGRSQI